MGEPASGQGPSNRTNPARARRAPASGSSPFYRAGTNSGLEDERILTNGSWHLCTDPNWEKYSFSSSVGETHTWLHGPRGRNRPGPAPAASAGTRGGAASSRASPSAGGGRGGRRRLTARHRPRNLSHEDVEEPLGAAAHRPRPAGRRHLGSCDGKAGGRPGPAPAVRSAARRGLAKMAAALTREGGEDAFRRLFRFYRQRDASDLRGVVDFSVPGGQVTPGSPCPRPASSSSRPLRGVAVF